MVPVILDVTSWANSAVAPANARTAIQSIRDRFTSRSSFPKTTKHLRRSTAERILVGTLNDLSALGALQAFRDLGLEDRCGIAGQYGVAEARVELRYPGARPICTVAYFPETYGEKLIRLAMDILRKRPVPPAVRTQHRLLTAANVDSIYPNDSWLPSVELPAGPNW